jgi:hypothetical protein
LSSTEWITRAGFPCSTRKNSKKRLFQPSAGRNPAPQVIDFIGSDVKFRYGAKQRNFFGLTAELNGLTAELQRNL